MNPRVSRSSALASKATGFPIAKIAAKLAVGYTLDEIPNDITRETPASFEPTIDYVVTKIPRFTFEKFPQADPTLTTQMKSVGEVMAIGRTFKESFQKAIRSLEIGHDGLREPRGAGRRRPGDRRAVGADRGAAPGAALGDRGGAAPRRQRGGDPRALAGSIRGSCATCGRSSRPRSALAAARRTSAPAWLRPAKQMGFSDRAARRALGHHARTTSARCAHASGVRPVYKRVDTCAAEFEAHTPYLYSTYEEESEAEPTDRQKIMILGGGPNRIGQGIEFDYCCVHAAFALREAGFETIMVNCNPETVSTDYDTCDRLYFEPLTLEDVLEIVAAREAATA